MTLPLLPIWFADFVGSGFVCVFSILAVGAAMQLRRTDPNNVVWTYLLWLCYALAAFGVSRSVGHIVRRLLLSSGHGDFWVSLQPLSGAVNSMVFVVVASITLFFERTWRIYEQIQRDRHALQEAHKELVYLNRNLERIVRERTRELSDSERKYRRIFEASQDMIMMTALDGAILDVNDAGVRMLGISSPVEPGCSPGFRDFFSSPEEWDRLLGKLTGEGALINHELELRGDDGHRFSALLSAKIERTDQAEGLEAIHFIAKDISKRKAMERHLLLADKLSSIGQLAAGVAHEVNNPLGMILGYTQLLIRGEEAGSQRYDDLRTIEKHTRTCKTIVERLLNFARSTQTRKEMTHIHGLIEEVLGLLRRPLELESINIEKDFDDGVPPLLLDREKMRQVFMNLLVNAKQAISGKGLIRITTRFESERGEVVVKVIDSGCGIEPANVTRIFDPFFTTKPTGEGTGLGLSVSYGIVQDHKGHIGVGTEPGGETVFTIVLPKT